MPPTNGDGPPLTTEDRSDATSAVITPVRIARRSGGCSPRSAVTCRVSLLAPQGRRTRWWYVARCPVCGRAHLARVRDLESVTATRRLPCGHWVAVVIARTYGAAA